MAKGRTSAFNTAINIISSLGVLFINVAISFVLSPYIIENIGVEANGFVNLSSNFVSYADLIVVALNAMAARFITIAYVNKDYKKANLYYNSVFWGNLIIVAVLLIPAIVFVAKLEIFINIPTDIVFDVKILFVLAFLCFFVKTAAPNWDCGTYITNRLDKKYIPDMLTAVLKCIFLFGIFCLFTPHVWYVGLVTTLMSMVALLISGYNTHILTPELKINLKKPICSLKVIGELVGAGIWSSIASVGNTFLSGLDLLVCNVFLGATQMGILSISKSLPNILATFSESIRGAFGPELTIAYANNDREEIKKCIIRSMKITSVVVTIPTAGIIVMSGCLYSLWLPSQNAKLLQILTSLTVLYYVFSSGVTPLNNVFTTVNKVKYNSIAIIISGLVSIMITVGVIFFSDWDLYAVAGISSIVSIVRDMTFMVPFTSRQLGFKWYQFYPQIAVSVISSALIIIVGIIVQNVIPVRTWMLFFVDCIIIGIIGLILNFRIVLNKEEQIYLVDMVRKRISR